MPAVSSPVPTATRGRILDAAFRVCQERGLQAATTREIAEAAQVNEVTLFRHFGNKEKLISALLERASEEQAETLGAADSEPASLEECVRRFAARIEKMMFQHEPLIRTLIGEARRQPLAAKQVIMEVVRPMRARFGEALREAQGAGRIRRDLHLDAAIDCFTGMLLSGMLRRTTPANALEYPQEDFSSTAIQLFLHGIAGVREGVSES